MLKLGGEGDVFVARRWRRRGLGSVIEQASSDVFRLRDDADAWDCG
jgi:hypothetical protein